MATAMTLLTIAAWNVIIGVAMLYAAVPIVRLANHIRRTTR